MNQKALKVLEYDKTFDNALPTKYLCAILLDGGAEILPFNLHGSNFDIICFLLKENQWPLNTRLYHDLLLFLPRQVAHSLPV